MSQVGCSCSLQARQLYEEKVSAKFRVKFGQDSEKHEEEIQFIKRDVQEDNLNLNPTILTV